MLGSTGALQAFQGWHCQTEGAMRGHGAAGARGGARCAHNGRGGIERGLEWNMGAAYYPESWDMAAAYYRESWNMVATYYRESWNMAARDSQRDVRRTCNVALAALQIAAIEA